MRTKLLLMFIALLFSAVSAFGQEYPKPVGCVNDFAHVLPIETANALNADCTAFEMKTTDEVVLVTIPSLQGYDVENYTRGLATAWGVGKKGKDNGVVLLIAPNEHRSRIEVADGVRSQLTDWRSSEIMQNDILPPFKKGDMPNGIADGMHAIMRVLDEPPPAPAPPPKPWTAEDTKHLMIWLGSIAVAIALIVLVASYFRRSNARNEVITGKKKLSDRIKEADVTAKHPDVKDETRKKLSSLKGDFVVIDRLTPDSERINWPEMREKLESLGYDLDGIVSTMEKEISFAEKARQEGPKLMSELPTLIQEMEKKIKEGKSSKKAAQYLEQARNQYAEAQRQNSGMTTTDWIILYLLLSSANQSCSNAADAHVYANTDHSSSYHSSASSGSSSESFSSGGFGGGGGFSGGGSTGSW